MLPTISRMGIFKKLFGQPNLKNVVTLFHEPSSAASVRALNLLKQAQANASTTTTIDQASDNGPQAESEQIEVDFDYQEDAPTSDQVATILQYIGPENVSKVIQGAKDEEDGLRKFKMNQGSFIKPVLVDWYGGKVVAGDNQSQILRLLKESRSVEPEK